MKRSSALAATVVFLFCSALAAPGLSAQIDGWLYTSTNSETVDGDSTKTELAVFGQFLTVNTTIGNGQSVDVRFDRDARELIIVDHANATYMKIDQAMLDQFAATLEQVASLAGGSLGALLESATAGMSDEDKARLEGLGIPGLGRVDTEEKLVAAFAGKAGTESTLFGQCEWWQYTFPNGDLEQELCITKSPLDGGAQALAAFADLADFMGALAEMAEQFTSIGDVNPFASMVDLPSPPVMMRRYEDGVLEIEMTLESVEATSFSAADGGAPEGMTEQSMMMGVPGVR